MISAKTKLCIIIGDPVEHSLSPAMHNAAYKALGIADEFVFIAARVKIEDIGSVVKAVRTMHIRGLTCTIPHKTEVIPYLDEIDPIAQKIGAVNTVVNDHGILKGYNTDWLGAVIPLEKITNLSGKRVAIMGAGGAARAIVYGLVERGALVKIYNRSLQNAKDLAQEIGAQAGSLEELPEVEDADIIINATSLGMKPHDAESPVPKKYVKEKHIVFDAVYVPHQTKLLREAKEKRATIVHGIEMLLHQGTAQFELYTNLHAPIEVMRNVLQERV